MKSIPLVLFVGLATVASTPGCMAPERPYEDRGGVCHVGASLGTAFADCDPRCIEGACCDALMHDLKTDPNNPTSLTECANEQGCCSNAGGTGGSSGSGGGSTGGSSGGASTGDLTVGQPCAHNDQCRSGLCYASVLEWPSGYCTESCSANAECVGGIDAVCSNHRCRVACSTDDACAAYYATAAQLTCNRAVLDDGSVGSFCEDWRNQPTGTQCMNTSQCAAGLACLPDYGFCSKLCQHDADCGYRAWCVEGSCYPHCSTSPSECDVFLAVTCVDVVTRDGVEDRACM